MEISPDALLELSRGIPEIIDAALAWPTWVDQDVGTALLSSCSDKWYGEAVVAPSILELVQRNRQQTAFKRDLII